LPVTWESLKDVLTRLADGTPPPPWAGLFGASLRPSDCQVVLIPVPWDATVSYGAGTAKGPEAMITASHQLDLEDGAYEQPFMQGITMLPVGPELLQLNAEARARAVRVLSGEDEDEVHIEADLAFVNAASEKVNTRVHALASEHLSAGRLVGVVGGDHSSPFGLIKALGERHRDGFGILHVDAHHDLRQAYEGFEHSHASIMYNVLHHVPAVHRLVQVGIRDYSREERDIARHLGHRGRTHYGRDLFRRQANGENWNFIVTDIIRTLPDAVYISFDIDGLDPAYCPGTGTPVPGGLSFDQAIFLIEAVAASGRKVIGFDLCEVAPSTQGGEWDANVGARLLYKLCGAALFANGLVKGVN
jgi:agmatinase